MALDQAQRQKLADWMAQRQVRNDCPTCGQSANWTPGDVVAAPIMKPGGMHIGGRVTPMVQLICANCAHVTFLAAEPVGLFY